MRNLYLFTLALSSSGPLIPLPLGPAEVHPIQHVCRPVWFVLLSFCIHYSRLIDKITCICRSFFSRLKNWFRNCYVSSPPRNQHPGCQTFFIFLYSVGFFFPKGAAMSNTPAFWHGTIQYCCGAPPFYRVSFAGIVRLVLIRGVIDCRFGV
jgi:hypothetical protein